jgi:RHS repeat-associated protein
MLLADLSNPAQRTTRYYHTDDLYNVMAVTDDAGNVVERYEYDDYGTPMIMAPDGTVLASSTIGNPYLFTGRRHDPETAWYHYRTRYLDPAAGRFTTRDTIGIWGDPWEFGNGYSYVGNGPLSWLDAFGLDRWIVNDGYPHQALVYGNDKIGYWKIEIGMFVPSFGAWWHWPKDIVEVIIRGAGAVTVGTEGEVTKTGTSRPDCPPDNYSSPEEDQKLHDDVQDRSRVYYHLLWRNSNQYPDEKLKHGLGEPGPRQEPSFQDASGLWISGRIIPQRGAQVSGRMDSK